MYHCHFTFPLAFSDIGCLLVVVNVAEPWPVAAGCNCWEREVGKEECYMTAYTVESDRIRVTLVFN